MDIFSMQFLSALAAIVVIDLVLAGDNAIVIALAARNLPAHLQKKAILWGTGGAIVVRSAMTMVVVWLLKIPGLLFIGGALLIWIAYRLLVPEEEGGDSHGPTATTFWGAMKTIVIADAIMGLDNVLAVAGAAHGSYLLVVLGLLISIPIVIWGSTLILGWVERFPAIVYVGAGVLAWTSAKMMASEPLIKPYLEAKQLAVPLLHVAVIGGVLWAGFARNHRRIAARIGTRLAAMQSAPAFAAEGGTQRILLPVDGTRNADMAVSRVIEAFRRDPAMEIHVLNVQAPFSGHVAQFVRKNTRDEHHAEAGEKALAPARRLLAQHGVPFLAHMKVGARARCIVDEAARLRCDRIVMGTARNDSITRMVQDSTTDRVLELANVPVEVITGNHVSRLERWGVPAGVGATLVVLLLLAGPY